MSKSVKKTVREIKSLKIQGSSKVRKAILEALKKSVHESSAKTLVAFKRELGKNALELLKARPTEPESRTAIRIILKAASVQTQLLGEAKESVIEAINAYEKNRKKAMETISEYGANLIQKDSVVFTHCHSHTVEEILKKAKSRIKYVISTETRPKFQGRITAQALTQAGLKVVQIVDSAALRFMKEADLFITGCDAVLGNGDIVNKIGTSQISLAAGKHDVPHFVATSSHCFEPLSYFGIPEEIEQRPSEEIWNKKLKGLSIRNPAFDVTPAHYIQEIITEKGVFAPETFAMLMFEELGIEHRKEEFLSLLKLLKK